MSAENESLIAGEAAALIEEGTERWVVTIRRNAYPHVSSRWLAKFGFQFHDVVSAERLDP